MKRYVALVSLILYLATPYSKGVSLEGPVVQELLNKEMLSVSEMQTVSQLLKKAAVSNSSEELGLFIQLLEKYQKCLRYSKEVYTRATCLHY